MALKIMTRQRLLRGLVLLIVVSLCLLSGVAGCASLRPAGFVY